MKIGKTHDKLQNHTGLTGNVGWGEALLLGIRQSFHQQLDNGGVVL